MEIRDVVKEIPNAITLLNIIYGMLAIYFSFKGLTYYVIGCFFIAIIFDFLDGQAAKMLNARSKLGKELDSLADVISFGIAPVIVTYVLISSTATLFVIGILFILSGVIRLAKYNVQSPKIKGFVGMPITINGFIIPLLLLVTVNPTIYLGYLIFATIAMNLPIKVGRMA